MALRGGGGRDGRRPGGKACWEWRQLGHIGCGRARWPAAALAAGPRAWPLAMGSEGARRVRGAWTGVLCAGAMHACVMRTCARRARVACACCVCPCCACLCCAPSCWACACAAVVSIVCTLLVNVVDIAGQSSRSCALRSSTSSTSRGVRLDRAAFARHRRRHHGVHVCARLHSHVLN